MAAVNAHVLLGGPRRYDGGMDPAFVALLRDAGPVIRWQVENFEEDNGLRRRTVVSAPVESLAVALGVAIHAAVGAPCVRNIIDAGKDGFLDITALSAGELAAVAEEMETHPVNLSAVAAWSDDSPFSEAVADSLVRWVAGDIQACAPIWSQIGSGHDGFATPGQRWTNPAWQSS